MVWECDGKRGALYRKNSGGNESMREEEERKAQEKMLGQCEA